MIRLDFVVWFNKVLAKILLRTYFCVGINVGAHSLISRCLRNTFVGFCGLGFVTASRHAVEHSNFEETILWISLVIFRLRSNLVEL